MKLIYNLIELNKRAIKVSVLYKKNYHITFLMSVLIILFIGCKNESKIENGPTNDSISVSKKIGKVSLILETSSSMTGYLTNDNQFKKVISDLSAHFDNISTEGKITDDCYYTTDNVNIKLFSCEAQKFINYLKKGVTSGSDTPLDQLFEKIVGSIEDGDVNGLISDYIFSPREGISLSTLEAHIQTVFNKAKNKNLAISIYQYESIFNGIYFDFNNRPINLINQMRPYYIWFFGDQEILFKFNKLLQKKLDFMGTNQLHIGYSYNNLINDKYETFPYKSNFRTGAWTFNNGIFNNVGNGDTIVIGINLNYIPNDLITLDYLKENLNCYLMSNENNLLCRVFLIDSVINKLNPKDIVKAKTKTHLIQVGINKISKNVDTVIIEIKKVLPDWYTSISTDDDRDIKNVDQQKTYAFKYLVNGAKSALESDSLLVQYKLAIKR